MTDKTFDIEEVIKALDKTSLELKKLAGLLRNVGEHSRIYLSPERDEKILSQPINDNNHSIRLANLIHEFNFQTYGELYEFIKTKDFRSISGWGRQMTIEMERFFFMHGLFYD